MARRILLHEILDLVLRDAASGDYVSARCFRAELGDLDADDCCVEDFRVCDEQGFELGGRDLEAFVFDKFLGALVCWVWS